VIELAAQQGSWPCARGISLKSSAWINKDCATVMTPRSQMACSPDVNRHQMIAAARKLTAPALAHVR